MVTKLIELLKFIRILCRKCLFYTRGNQLRELLKCLARAHNIFYIFGTKKEPIFKIKATQTNIFVEKIFQK